MRCDEYISSVEIQLIEKLKDKSRMEQDQIIGEWKNGKL